MILVTGTGRSGTSVVARILHEQLGVDMGGPFQRAPRANPDGTYEDPAFRAANIARWRGEINADQWVCRVTDLAASRQRDPWGFKDPRASHFIRDYIELFTPSIIWCYRSVTACAISCNVHYHKPFDRAWWLMCERFNALDQALAEYPHLRMDMNAIRREDDLRGEINAWLSDLTHEWNEPAGFADEVADG